MMKGGMQVVTFQRQRERQAEELLLTPGEMAARCDWQQVRRMREEMPDDVCSTQAWYQNCDALDRELRAQYPMIGALETAVRAYGYAMENSTRPRVQETMRWRLTLDQFGILAQVLARHGLIADVRGGEMSRGAARSGSPLFVIIRNFLRITSCNVRHYSV